MSNNNNLPPLKAQDCSSFSTLTLIYKRAETRIRTNLTHFNKFSLRLSNQSNQNAIQDLDYWQNEFTTRQHEMVKTFTLLTTVVGLISVFPNPLPGQEWNESIEYIDPYVQLDDVGGGQYSRQQQQPQSPPTRLDPAFVVGNLVSTVQGWVESKHIVQPLTQPLQPQQRTSTEPYQYQPISLTPPQIAFSRRCLAVLSEITMDYNRNKDLCQSALNRMQLFSPVGQNHLGDDFGDDDNGDGTDFDTDNESSDIESQLLNGDGKGGKMLKAENSLIQQSLKQSQYAINNAQQSTESLARQRDIFDNIISRVGTITSRFPGMTAAMNAIQNRRNRDNCILATLVAFLLFITFLYVSWKHS